MTPRFGLSLVRLEESVFVLGGNTVGGLSSSSIEKFDIATGTWTKFSDSLLSTSTTGLAVTTLPSSAVGCDQDCQCGVALAKAERIIGGQQAEVFHNFQFEWKLMYRKETSYPWAGILLVNEQEPRYGQCIVTLVSYF